MKSLLLCSTLALLSTAAMANSDFVKGDKTFAADAEVGATFTSGNTQTSSFKAKLDMKHELGNWENEYIIEGLYKDDKGSVTAKNYKAGIQGNYQFNEDNYIYGNTSYEVDEFKGLRYRSTNSIGYGHKFYETQDSFLKAEIGPGYIYDRLTEQQALKTGRDSENTLVLHTVIDFKAKVSDTSTFLQKFIIDTGDKVTARSESSITAKVVDALAMKFGVVVTYNSKPLESIKSTDTETTLTLLYSF